MLINYPNKPIPILVLEVRFLQQCLAIQGCKSQGLKCSLSFPVDFCLNSFSCFIGKIIVQSCFPKKKLFFFIHISCPPWTYNTKSGAGFGKIVSLKKYQYTSCFSVQYTLIVSCCTSSLRFVRNKNYSMMFSIRELCQI